MSREKQISEMAWLKCCCHSNKGICGMDGKPCDLDCGSYHEAEALYNAGYRKSTDVAEEIFAEIEKEIELALDCNYKVKRDSQDMNDTLVIYVEGKIDCLRGLLGYIAELKEKYTEEGK